MDHEAISHALADIGREIDAAFIEADEAGGSWTIALATEDRAVIAIDQDDFGARYVLSADLGAPPVEAAAAVHARLLGYNLAWAGTGGVWMGVDPADGTAVMFYGLPMSDLTAQRLHQALRDFALAMRAQQALLLGGAEKEASDEADLPTPMPQTLV